MPTKRKHAYTAAIDGICHSINTTDPVEILVLADLHIGDPQSDVRLIQQLVDGVRDNPNRYCILAGDLLNNAVICGGKSDPYTATMTPTQQMQYAVKLLEPIKDKILGVVPGNHEARTTRAAGFDLTLAICSELGISRVYSDDAALVLIKFGRDKHGTPITYSVYVSHGRGGGRKPAGKINALSEYGGIIDADIYCVGHTHLPAMYKDQTYRISPQRGQATLRERLFLNTASALLYGDYAKRAGYQPASNSYPIITLDPRERRATATV